VVLAPAQGSARKKELHLWSLPRGEVARDRLAAEGEALLSPAERRRLEAISHDGRARSFCLGRALLREALACQLDCAPQDLVFGEGENGKPFLIGEERNGLDFSLSHGAGELLVAVAETEGLGVDLEAVTRAQQVLEIAKRLFAPEERRLLEEAGEKAAPLALLLWTLKEAVTKSLGQTIWQAVGQVVLGVKGSEIAWLCRQPRGGPESWTLLSGNFRGSHRFALALWHPQQPSGTWQLRCHRAGDGDGASEAYDITASAGGWEHKAD